MVLVVVGYFVLMVVWVEVGSWLRDTGFWGSVMRSYGIFIW
jgi:hypothetical protein